MTATGQATGFCFLFCRFCCCCCFCFFFSSRVSLRVHLCVGGGLFVVGLLFGRRNALVRVGQPGAAGGGLAMALALGSGW
ncbi:hypothetical protein B0I35DRAFT_216199 [Stachybotrys elegans]|uniref:Uncharacterized protein n=1 Tax=Stachybotrys elegans TaxID=80388 RepID=A0A8K0SQU1_9HYPO|nr:hypothetical protein B0I35DRAFT_216199 [Stachybotrys elegans]